MKNKKVEILARICWILISLLILMLRLEGIIEIPNIIMIIIFILGLLAFPIAVIAQDSLNENKLNKKNIKKSKAYNEINEETFEDLELKKMFRNISLFSPGWIWLISLLAFLFIPPLGHYLIYGTLDSFRYNSEDISTKIFGAILLVLCAYSAFYYLKTTKKIDEYINREFWEKIASRFGVEKTDIVDEDVKNEIGLYLDEMQLTDCNHKIDTVFRIVNTDKKLVGFQIEKWYKTIVYNKPTLGTIFDGLDLIMPVDYSLPEIFVQTANLETLGVNNKIIFAEPELVRIINDLKKEYQKDIRVVSCDNNKIHIVIRQPKFSSDNDSKKAMLNKVVDYYYGIKCLLDASDRITKYMEER